MKTYTVTFTEVATYRVEVEADSPEDAETLATLTLIADEDIKPVNGRWRECAAVEEGTL